MVLMRSNWTKTGRDNESWRLHCGQAAGTPARPGGNTAAAPDRPPPDSTGDEQANPGEKIDN